MNIKLLIYLISIISISILAGFHEWINESLFNWQFFLAIIILFLIHLRFYKFYSFLNQLKNSSKITNGLLYSSMIGFLIVFLIIQGDYSYKKIIGSYVVETGSNIYFYIIGAYLLIGFICFIIDSFFTKETKNINKWRIMLSSLIFYAVSYVISFTLAMIMAVTSGLSFS